MEDEEIWKNIDKFSNGNVSQSTWSMFFLKKRVPNLNDICMYWDKKTHPYTRETLPNYRRTATCFNCKFSDKMSCGSHIEWDCGICHDYVADEDGVCDLHEWE